LSVDTFVRDEHGRATKLIQEGLNSGPLAAYRKVAQRKVDAPWAVKLATLTLLRIDSDAAVWTCLVTSMVVVPCALLFGTNVLTDAPLAVQLVGMAPIAFVTLAVSFVLYGLVFGRNRRELMRLIGGWSVWDRAYWMALMVIVPTVGFAILTAFGVSHHLFGLAGNKPQTDDVSFDALNTYLWNLAHAVPLLDVTDTLRWKTSLEFREWYGGNLLVLVYKIALIVPLLQLASIMLRRLLADERSATG
jgi:hypothetical protein